MTISATRKEYTRDLVFWGLITMCWYRKSLFRSLPNCTLSQSKLVLWVILLAFAVLYIVSARRNEGCCIPMTVALLSAYELYTILSYSRTFPYFYLVVLVIAITSAFAVSWRTINRKAYKHEATSDRKSRVREAMIRGYSTIALICAVIVVPMFISFGLGDSLIWKNTSSSVPENNSEWTIINNIEVVSNLREDKWQSLSASEKVNTLQVIANIERQYLGLPHEINVIVSRCREETLACYDDSTHTITLNIEFFDDQTAHELVDSICHECYHSYQHRLCDAYRSIDSEYSELLLFDDIPHYLSEFADYEDGYENPMGYYLQLCEARARQYAQQSVEDYYAKIALFYGPNEYLPSA